MRIKITLFFFDELIYGFVADMSEDSVELRLRAAEERADIVFRYDRGRDEGAEIPDWEDPDMEIYHVMDR